MVGREALQVDGTGQRLPVDFDDSHIDFARGVPSLPPDRLAAGMEQDRQHSGTGKVVRIGMQLNFEAVRKMCGGLVDQDVPAGDQEQALAAFKKEARRAREGTLAVEGRHTRGRQAQGLDQGCPPRSYPNTTAARQRSRPASPLQALPSIAQGARITLPIRAAAGPHPAHCVPFAGMDCKRGTMPKEGQRGHREQDEGHCASRRLRACMCPRPPLAAHWVCSMDPRAYTL